MAPGGGCAGGSLWGELEGDHQRERHGGLVICGGEARRSQAPEPDD